MLINTLNGFTDCDVIVVVTLYHREFNDINGRGVGSFISRQL